MWTFSGRKLECFQEYEACCPTAPILTTQIPKSSSKGKGPLNSQFSVRRNKAIQLWAQAMPHGKGRMPWREEKCPQSRKKSHREPLCMRVCVCTHWFWEMGNIFSFTFPLTFVSLCSAFSLPWSCSSQMSRKRKETATATASLGLHTVWFFNLECFPGAIPEQIPYRYTVFPSSSKSNPWNRPFKN